jgi:hypothetical protein
MVFDAATLGDKFEKLSKQTGISTTRLQELAYAGTLMDVDLETMTSGLRFLTRSMYAARDGTGEQADAFKSLGISVLDVHGNLRDADIVFGEAIDALGKMTNSTEADAITMKLMGRNAMELNPLIRAGSKALAEYSLEAHDMGAVISEEDVRALDLLKDRFDALKLSAKGVMATFAIALLPAFQQIEGMVSNFMKDIAKTKNLKELLVVGKKWMKKLSYGMTKGLAEFKKNIPKIIKAITGFLKDGLPEFLVFATNVITTIIKGIAAALPTLIPAAATILSTLIKALSDNWPKIMAAGKEVLRALVEGIRAGWETLKPKLPTIGEIIDWIFKTAADLTGRFLKWLRGIDWAKVSGDIAKTIRSINWTRAGEEFRRSLDDLGKTLAAIAKEIKWVEVSTAIGTAVDDFIIGALTWGKEDAASVQEQWGKNIDLIAGVIVNYGWEAVGKAAATQIGNGIAGWWDSVKTNPQTAANNAAFKEWFNGLWTLPKTGLWVSFDTAMAELQTRFTTWWANTQEWFNAGWQTYFMTPFESLKTKLHQTGIDLVNALQTGITGAWGAFVILIQGLVDAFVRAVMNSLNPLLTLLGVSAGTGKGAPKTPAPAPPAPPTPPRRSFAPTVGAASAALGAAFGVGGGTTNNITVNNPSAEPASTSVSSVLKKLSYLGVPA